jgi:hypothetical protein
MFLAHIQWRPRGGSIAALVAPLTTHHHVAAPPKHCLACREVTPSGLQLAGLRPQLINNIHTPSTYCFSTFSPPTRALTIDRARPRRSFVMCAADFRYQPRSDSTPRESARWIYAPGNKSLQITLSKGNVHKQLITRALFHWRTIQWREQKCFC